MNEIFKHIEEAENFIWDCYYTLCEAIRNYMNKIITTYTEYDLDTINNFFDFIENTKTITVAIFTTIIAIITIIIAIKNKRKYRR